jgi:hypothetical protein
MAPFLPAMPILHNAPVRFLTDAQFDELDEVVMRCAYASQNKLGRLCEEAVYENDLAARLRAEGLYAYTAIRAPRGLKERIEHVWLYEGREVDRIPLAIHGGRKEGYRTWTHKLNFPESVIGDWQVRVMTESGQMIGVVRFRVVES